MSYLDATIAAKLSELIALQKKEVLAPADTPTEISLASIVDSQAKIITLLLEHIDVTTKVLLEMKQVKLGMSLAMEEDLEAALDVYESAVNRDTV